MIGRHYHRAYGYPWRHAFTAEVWWRLEHSPLRHIVNAYARRKAAERRGAGVA